MSTDQNDATAFDLIIETDISKSLHLAETNSLSKFVTKNGSALLQISKAPWPHFRWVKKLITLYIKQHNSTGFRIALSGSASDLNYFALSISPSLENPNDIILLPCTVDSGELYIPRESARISGSIAVLATTRDAPFSHMLCGLSDSMISATTITRIMFRERGSLVVEIKDAHDNHYISRSSQTAKGKKNIEKNHYIIKSLLNNPAIPRDAKQLIPRPVAKTFNASIEEKKPGQLAWKIIEHHPDLERSIISQAWDFCQLLSTGTGRSVIIDSKQFDAIAGSDLKYIQQFCSNDNEVTRLLVLIKEYLLKRLLDNEMYVVFGHGDFGFGNILYDSKTARLTGIIDWDTARVIELPCVDFINLLIQKFRSHNSMDKSYHAALRWLTSELPLPIKIRGQIHEKFGITDKDLKLYSVASILHLMGRDFRFRELGSIRPEERDTLILVASSVKQTLL